MVHTLKAALSEMNLWEEREAMQSLTTGPGISGSFADEVATLVCDLRTESKDQRWHAHVQASRTSEYALRVYGPDHHTELYSIPVTSTAATTIRKILIKEAKSWQLRARAAGILETAPVPQP